MAPKKRKYICNIYEYEGQCFDFGFNTTILLLDRIETERCEATVVIWPSGNKGPVVAHKDKEQTFFILSGNGWVTIADKTMLIKPGDVIFVPQNIPHTTKTGNKELSYLCLNTFIKKYDKSFAKMFKRVA